MSLLWEIQQEVATARFDALHRDLDDDVTHEYLRGASTRTAHLLTRARIRTVKEHPALPVHQIVIPSDLAYLTLTAHDGPSWVVNTTYPLPEPVFLPVHVTVCNHQSRLDPRDLRDEGQLIREIDRSARRAAHDLDRDTVVAGRRAVGVVEIDRRVVVW